MRVDMPVPPTIRHMILCRDYDIPEDGSGIVDIRGLTTSIEIENGKDHLETDYEICFVAVIRSIRNRGIASVTCIYEGVDDHVAFADAKMVEAPNSPLEYRVVSLRFEGVWFPIPGLYRFDLCYNEMLVDSQTLLVEEGP